MQKRVMIAFGSILGLFVLALAFGIYYLGSNTISQNPSPTQSLSSFPTITQRAFPVVWVSWGGGYGYRNVTRGSSFSINFELENHIENQTEVTLTFETTGRDPQSPLSALDYINSTFSAPNPVTLQPREKKLLTLTVSIADDTPFGKYLFTAQVESLDFDGKVFHEGHNVAFTVVP
jgi:hypothetical protein